MKTKIVNATQKGQITLPKEWRDKFATSHFLLEEKNGGIFVEPIEIDEDVDMGEQKGWKTIFSADRDNKGEGIPADEFLRVLKRIDGQD